MNNTNFCQNSCPEVNLVLTSNNETLKPCDLVTYTCTITNNDPNVSYGYFKDNLPCPLVFIPGTLTVNGTAYLDLNPEKGFNVNFLTFGNTITLTYTCKAYGDSCCCVKVTTCDCCRKYRPLNHNATLCFKQCCCTKNAISNAVVTNVEY